MASLARRLRVYMDLFLRRSDIETLSREVTVPTTPPRAELLPPDVVGLRQELTSLTFTWRFADALPEEVSSSHPSRHGGLWLGPLDVFSWRESSDADWRYIDEDADESARLGGEPGSTEAFHLIVPWESPQVTTRAGAYIGVTAFIDGGGCETHTRFPSLEAYLTLGARKGFVEEWDFWWVEDEDIMDALELWLWERSLPRETPREVILARLEARGASPEDARALFEWLGEDVVVLLERDYDS